MKKARNKRKPVRGMEHESPQHGEVIIYRSNDGKTAIDVRLEDDTVWLSQMDMGGLFGTTSENIIMHIQNIYRARELRRSSTTKDILAVRTEGERQVKRTIKVFNLDMIIAVGYRVNTRRGTQFRIWATEVLRRHLIEGYTINEKRLVAENARLKDLEKSVRLLTNVVIHRELTGSEAQALLRVVADYWYALEVLDRYDHGTLEIRDTSKKELYRLTYDEAIVIIDELKNSYGGSDLFAMGGGDAFRAAIEAVYQTYAGADLLQAVEEKAAALLYYVVKDHCFVYGNKRIAASVFLHFLAKNGLLYRDDGSKRLADNALVALTLLIAESRPEEKDVIMKVIVNLINKSN